MQFSYEEALAASIEYFNGDKLAANKFLEKYALRDKNNKLREKTPDDMHKRLAEEFARIDKKFGGGYDAAKYYDAMKNFKRIVPQGSPMQAIGNKFSTISASNCFVIDAASHGDSIGGIMMTITEAAEIMKRRGGVGIDISCYRPSGASVNNAALSSTGVISISDALSYFGRYIGQCGRQGAQMITISDRHPDILNFIKMKEDKTKVTGANVSIKISNEFINAVENNKKWELRWPVDGEAKITKVVNAKDLWEEIVEQAWKNGEPGLLMWDNYCDNLPAHYYDEFKTITTNPCAEIGLSAYDSCRLISMNLFGYVTNPHTVDASFDFEKFKSDVALSMRMEDNLVELEIEIIDRILNNLDNDTDDAKLPFSVQRSVWTKIKNAAANGRRTGLGTHGLADCLNALGIAYNKADKIVNDIYSTFSNVAYNTSVDLAIERGHFPVFNWDKEKNCPFIKRLPKATQDRIKKHGRRNISLLTVAPTGTVSLMSQTSSGIEPVYDYVYIRKTKILADQTQEVHSIDQNGDKWHHYVVMHNEFENYLRINNVNIDKVKNDLIKNDINGKPKTTVDVICEHIKLPKCWKVTASTLDVEDRLRIIGKIQSYIDHGVSQTCNFPKGTKKELVEKYYIDACHNGLKGVTVYVDGSRTGVLVSAAKQESKHKERPRDIECNVHRSNGHVVLVGLLDGEVHEVFAGEYKDLPVPDGVTGAKIRKLESRCYALRWPVTTHTRKTRYASMPIKESFLKDEGMTVRLLTNLAIRSGASLDDLVETIFKSSDMSSFSRHVARVLSNYVKNAKAEGCCSNPSMIYEDGCKKCISCGWSKCA